MNGAVTNWRLLTFAEAAEEVGLPVKRLKRAASPRLPARVRLRVKRLGHRTVRTTLGWVNDWLDKQ